VCFGSDTHKFGHIKKLKSVMEDAIYERLLTRNPLRNNSL